MPPERRNLREANLKEDAAASIRDMIFAGDLKPGSKIDQRGLADLLGISLLPVREALISLERQGLVRSIPRRGAYVALLQPDDLRDHYQIFAELSSMACERAALRLEDEQLRELEALVTEMDRESVPETLEQLNFRFHSLITRGSGSSQLMTFIQLLESSVPRGFHAHGWELVQKHHHDILDRLVARDADGARRAMRDHVNESAEHALTVLEESGFWADAES